MFAIGKIFGFPVVTMVDHYSTQYDIASSGIPAWLDVTKTDWKPKQ